MIPAIDRKLLRDLWRIKGQALAIACVIGSGICMFVMYRSTFDSLGITLASYYGEQRFAEVFVSAKRVPESLAPRIGAIPGVARAETRVVASVTLDMPGMDEPAMGRLISVPAEGRPRLNDVFLRRGRWIAPGRPDEVVASESFALAHGLQPGESLIAVLNGTRRRLRVVGIGLTPEYIYSIRPGDLMPDPKRFGILWMERKALAAAGHEVTLEQLLHNRGGGLRHTTAEDWDLTLRVAARYGVESIVVEEPDLEELFFTYYRGAERPPPDNDGPSDAA